MNGKGFVLAVLLVGAVPAAAAPPEAGAAVALPVGAASEAIIPFAGPDAVTYRGVLVHREWWVPLPEQWQFVPGGSVEISFSHSPVLIERLSAMTLSINDIAVGSAMLSVQNARDAKVAWPIDPSWLRPGDSNKIVLTAKMRGDLELCDDVHSPALWLTLEKQSRLLLKYVDRPVTLDLSRFPDNYVRPEIYYAGPDADPTHCVIAVPTGASSTVLRGAAIVAARLGRATHFPKGRVEVVQLDGADAEAKARLGKYHLVLIGPTAFVQTFLSAGLNVKDVLLGTPSAGVGYLIEAHNPWNSGRRALVVTGADDDAIAKVVTALSLPHLAAQWRVKEGQPPIRAQSFTEAPAIPPGAQEGANGTYAITLRDLGASNITGRGKFHHFINVAFPNPFVGRIKAPAFIRLFASHSELLVPQTSSLLVKINGEPVRSIRLSPRSAQKLEADIVIPEKFFGDRVISVDLEAFLDIGEPDCHYSYPEMAWFTLFDTSFVAYPLSETPTTSLRSYPWVAAKEPNLSSLTFVVDKDATDADLSAVANIAAFLGTSLPRSLAADPADQWLSPNVRRVDELSADEQAQRDIIVVGGYGLVRQNAQITAAVPDSLFTEGAAQGSSPRAYATHEYRTEAGWIHLARSPWNEKRNLLVVSGAKGAPAIARTAEHLWSKDKVESLGGSTIMIGTNGAMQVLTPAPGEGPQSAPAGPFVPRMPEEVKPLPTPSAANVASPTTATVPDQPTAPAVEAVAVPTGGGKGQVAYFVFAVLGLMLAVLVIVRIRDALRSGNRS